jgi:hypothetical protein
MDSDNQSVSRANMLRTLAAAPIAIGAFAAMQAEAAAAATKGGTLAQKAVQYQTTPKGGAQCSTCKFFINGKTKTSTGACTQVAGPISPKGWCEVYSKGDNSKQHL